MGNALVDFKRAKEKSKMMKKAQILYVLAALLSPLRPSFWFPFDGESRKGRTDERNPIYSTQQQQQKKKCDMCAESGQEVAALPDKKGCNIFGHRLSLLSATLQRAPIQRQYNISGILLDV